MSNQQAAPGSPVGRKMTDTTTPPGAPPRPARRPQALQRRKGARNLFDSGALGMEGSTMKPMPGGRRRRRRKSKRKSHKKSHKKRRTKKRRKSRKKKSKRRRRR
jgi:hypothetical protein